MLASQQALAKRDPKIIQAAQAHFDTIKQKIEALRPITRQARNIQQIDDAQKAADAYKAAMNALLTAWVAREDLMALRTTAGEAVTKEAKEITLIEMDEVTTIGTDAEKALSSASSIMLVGLIVALVVGCVVALVITRSITGPLNRAIAAMTAGSQEVASAAGQISTASQNLAEGATEQASSLEESSSALEELASQAGGNAEKPKRAPRGPIRRRGPPSRPVGPCTRPCGHERDQGVVQPDFGHHQDYRGDRFPDEPAGLECGGRGGARG
jgi:methyl-accepting chemotaxis protein